MPIMLKNESFSKWEKIDAWQNGLNMVQISLKLVKRQEEKK